MTDVENIEKNYFSLSCDKTIDIKKLIIIKEMF